jgi:hypothetical protein
MITFGRKVSNDYGWEITLFHKLREFSDGVTFLETKINWRIPGENSWDTIPNSPNQDNRDDDHHRQIKTDMQPFPDLTPNILGTQYRFI